MKDERSRQAGAPQGILLVMTSFLPMLAIVALTPAVPEIIRHFAATANPQLFVPLLVSAPGLAIAIFAPIAGAATDRWGRRPLLLATTAVYGVVGALPFVLPTITSIIAARFVLGICEAGILTVANTLLADYFELKARRRWLTIQGVVGAVLGTAILPISGALAGLHWSAVFLIYLIAIPIAMAMVPFLFEPRLGASEPTAPPSTGMPWRSIAAFGLGTLFTAILYYVFIIHGGLAFAEVGVTDPARLGRILGVASIGVPIGALIYGALSARRVSLQLAVVFGLLGCGLGGMGLSTGPIEMAAMLFVQQLGIGMAIPSLVAWAQSCLPYEHRGRGMGIWTSCFFLGQFTCPLAIGGARALTGTMQGAFGVLGSVALAAACIAIALAIRGRSNKAGINGVAPPPRSVAQ